MITLKKKWLLFGIFNLILVISFGCANKDNYDDSPVTSDTNTTELTEEKEEKPEIDEEEQKQQTEPTDESSDHPDKHETYELDIHSDESMTALVNKQHSLQDNYEPNDLVTVDVPTILENPEVNQLRKEAANALKEMFNEALETNITLYARSGYRSHQTQEQLFNSYAEEHGEEAANRYRARPGQSEHQTGLVMDVTSESVNFQLVEAFDETEEGKWLQDNAHKFGFIIRYPQDKEDITGYIYEPWHLRYLGVDVATAVYESGLTYEEFLVKEGIIHEVNS